MYYRENLHTSTQCKALHHHMRLTSSVLLVLSTAFAQSLAIRKPFQEQHLNDILHLLGILSVYGLKKGPMFDPNHFRLFSLILQILLTSHAYHC